MKVGAGQFFIVGESDASPLAAAAAEALPSLKLLEQSEHMVSWSQLVDQKRELWPIQDLLPGGAYIH
jgi:hypothetical protein